MYKILLTFLFLLSGCLLYPGKACAAPRLQDTGEKTVIVIDPGHGGENRGTIEYNHDEKLMTMTTAMAMYEELLLYDDVEVYLTHTEDVDMSLKERAEFAESVEADFLFSIHYNASENHELFGSEIWVSSLAPFNGYGYQFGYEFLTDMREKGLLVRGVKTRLGSGGEDYYGIIREAVNLEIPAVIIEHCHVDHERDIVYCDSEEKLKEFGRADATAVAKYFQLKSSALDVDYSDYQLAEADGGSVMDVTMADSTEPNICLIDFREADYENGSLSLTVSAADYDSNILYYNYSIDGGRTFTPWEAWPESDTLTGSYPDSFTLDLSIPPGVTPEVLVRAYNTYGLYTESNPYVSPQAYPKEEEELTVEGQLPAGEPKAEVVPVMGDGEQEETGQKTDMYQFVMICLAAAFVMLVVLFGFQYISYRNRKNRRLQRRNEEGIHRNQQR